MSVFGLAEQIHRCWRGLSDLDHTIVEAWEKSFEYPNAEQMPERFPAEAVEPMINRNREFIVTAGHELSLIDAEIAIPHLFLVTDPNGIVIQCIGQEDILGRVQGYNVDVGTSFAFQYAGVNGISLAMHLQSTAVVRGDEHTMQLFKDWACICSPVRMSDEVYGYIDLSFRTDVDVTFAVPLLNKTIEKIERKLQKNKQSISREAAYVGFEPYKLTNREKEVALGWLQNKSALQLAHGMGITEGTVRNMLKKVYAKTGVGDKGQFFRKFLV